MLDQGIIDLKVLGLEKEVEETQEEKFDREIKLIDISPAG
jgi:hypothetical protein